MKVLLNKLELLRGRMASTGDARPHADRVIKRAVCRDLQHPSLPDDACSKERGAAGPDGGRTSTHAGCRNNRGDVAAGEQLKQETLRVVSSGNSVLSFIQKFRMLRTHCFHVVGTIVRGNTNYFLTELIHCHRVITQLQFIIIIIIIIIITNLLTFVMEMQCVSCAIGIEYLDFISINLRSRRVKRTEEKESYVRVLVDRFQPRSTLQYEHLHDL